MVSDGGKGSARRKEDSQAVRDNWDRIFGKKEETPMIEEHEDGNEDYTDETDEYDYCHVCSGSGEGMYDGSSCHACGGTGNATVDKEDDCYDDYE
jgi:DnaJ-class molecular chaperone